MCYGEEEKIQEPFSPQRLLSLRNPRGKRRTRIYIIQDLNFFPDLTILRSKQLCLMKERTKKKRSEMIPSVMGEIYVTKDIEDWKFPKVVWCKAQVREMEHTEDKNVIATGHFHLPGDMRLSILKIQSLAPLV